MKKLISLFTVLLLAVPAVWAKKQKPNLEKPELKQYNAYIRQGDKLFENTPYEKTLATTYYLKAFLLDSSSAELCYKIGSSYLYSTQKVQALKYFQRSVALDSTDANYKAFWKLANTYQLALQFDTAITLYDRYLLRYLPKMSKSERKAQKRLTEKRIMECRAGRELVKEEKQVFIDPVTQVNTREDEYNPIISPDASTLTYTTATWLNERTRKETAMNVFKADGGEFGTPEPLVEERGRSNFSVVSLGDNDYMLYDGTKPHRITQYAFIKNRWKKTGKMKWNKKNPVKRISFNSDSTQVYFSSITKQKKKKATGYDIYMATKNEKGKWQKAHPVGVGTTSVNTEYDEISPVILGDSALFFSSNGHNTMGGYDLFVSYRRNGLWSRAVNIGYPVNTPFDDVFYCPANRWNKAYMASNRDGGEGETDIYHLTFIYPKELSMSFEPPVGVLGDGLLGNIRLEKAAEIDSSLITVLHGYILDEEKQYLIGHLELADNRLQQIIVSMDADSTGYYRIQLPAGSNLGLSVSCKGYLFHSENFDLPEQTQYQEIEKNIVLKKIAIGKNVIMKNIFFETAKADLSNESQIELNNLIKLLNDNPTLHLEIGGHTDNKGSRAYNQKLSQSRAESVVHYLVEHGISPERLTSKGYAFDVPVADNKTEEGRRENRRTEFLVTKF
ncbi:MAG: OmpA family protein [Paludibacteraceae bacterium]|nr:OmpA family protein [Paludibacteraceae bacterium]